MNRIILGTVALSSLLVAVPALAADWMAAPALRTSYPNNWQSSDANPLTYETGIRYWYSLGYQEHNIGDFSESNETKTSSGEIFARINDLSTQSYVEATAGYGVAHSGSYSVNGGADVDLPAARLGYVGADFGWLAFGDETARFGLMTGYQFTKDSPDTGSANFLTTPAVTAGGAPYSITGGGDSEVNDFRVHELKLGLAGRFDGGAFDITGEAAAIPYSWIGGTYGGFSVPGQSGLFRQTSAAQIEGNGYGASGKLMVGFHPTENLTIRVGGKASYLTGQYDATYDSVMLDSTADNTITAQRWIFRDNPFEMIRYGALLEISGSF
ncbi:MAG: hypothetical protein P0Y65_10905 [Candidatus Devosia phytovorans]|uniref:Porin n=1 Tax=Candidatus Devosia phytovorans TaxID=3121372 RepID=A0AAJ5VS73_9HYPH|nr:hypothetical protein [Devosia sp.]WEK02717.1 MAG: hypothetical protein P0Y65_10905 [Devosia sp.]